jgi:hypothetical protein
MTHVSVFWKHYCHKACQVLGKQKKGKKLTYLFPRSSSSLILEVNISPKIINSNLMNFGFYSVNRNYIEFLF